MKNQSKTSDSKVVPTVAAPLDAPLALPADQLELVAGGMVPTFGPFGPTTGLIRVLQ